MKTDHGNPSQKPIQTITQCNLGRSTVSHEINNETTKTIQEQKRQEEVDLKRCITTKHV